MKKALFICCILLTSLSYAHESFFAFAEVEYDDLSGKIETTISMTTHDLEYYLQKKKIITKNLSTSLEDSILRIAISKEIIEHFNMSTGNNRDDYVDINARTNFEGFELFLNGKVEFYYSASLEHPLKSIQITFDLFMDEYPEQQNKLHLIYRNQKKDYVFLPSKKTQLIEFN